MSHFNDREYFIKREYVENYYKDHNDYNSYFEKALCSNSTLFRTWIFLEYNRLSSLGERHKLCEKGHKCNTENCLKCPYEKGAKI